MNWATCLEEHLIRKDHLAKARIPASIDAAERFVHSAERTHGIEEYELAHLAAYTSAFHSARALLFSRGYTERSHICVVLMLRHVYADDLPLQHLLSTLDKMRISRHNVQYGVQQVSREEAAFTIQFAGKFLLLAKERIEKV